MADFDFRDELMLREMQLSLPEPPAVEPDDDEPDAALITWREYKDLCARSRRLEIRDREVCLYRVIAYGALLMAAVMLAMLVRHV